MKLFTSSQNRNYFFIYKSTTKSLCEKFLTTGLSDWRLGLLSLLGALVAPLSPVWKKMFSLLQGCAPANLGHVFLASMTLVKSTMLNNRLYTAFLFFCFSPVGFCLHLFFDRKVKYEWMGFIENWFHYFNLIGPYIFVGLVLTGVFFLIPPAPVKKVKVFRWTLSVQLSRMLSVPVGITIAKIIWLSIITSNEDFFGIPTYAYFIIGFIIGYAYYKTFEYFIWRKFHAYDGLVCTIEGLNKSDVDKDTRSTLAEPLFKELKNFNQLY